MFENFRGRIHNVQKDISSGLLNLSVDKKHEAKEFEAGADVLAWHQKHWEEIHSLCNHNISLVDDVGKDLVILDNYSKRVVNVINEFTNHLGSLDKISESIDVLLNDICLLKKSIALLEQNLVILEEERLKQIAEKQSFNLKCSLMLFREKKNMQFEELKIKLSKEHAKKMKSFEKNQQIKYKERQEAFQAAFEQEVEYYKKFGRLEKREIKTLSKSLENIEVEPDEEDKQALDRFLQDQ